MDRRKLGNYTISERISYLRKEREMSQIDLAKEIGISRSMMSQLESGKKNPTVETLEALAKALEVEVAIFFISDKVHVFDMEKLNKKYKKVDDLNDTIKSGIVDVLRYAKKVGFEV